MDSAVLKAYSWEDIDITCGFSLDYLDLDEDSNLDPETQDRIATGDYDFPTAEEASNFDALIRKGKKRKLPWRYRWSQTTHDEILARLLDLNQSRYEDEILGGKQSQKKTKTQTKNKQKRVKSKQNTPTIPASSDD